MDLNLLKLFHNRLLGVEPDQHHKRQHPISGSDDHTGRALLSQMPVGASGKFLKATGAGNDPIYDNVPDLVPAHKDATTGVHGVGVSTVESASGAQNKVDIHAALKTGVHGVGSKYLAHVRTDGYNQVARTATYVVAASDAPVYELAQADRCLSSTTDRAGLEAAIALVPTGGKLQLSSGTFPQMKITKAMTVSGMGWGTVVTAPNAAGSLLTANANAGQKNVAVTSTATFYVGCWVHLTNTAHSVEEYAVVASINGNTLTMVDNLTNTYTTAAGAIASEDTPSIWITAGNVKISNLKVNGNRANRVNHLDKVGWSYWDSCGESEGEIYVHNADDVTLQNVWTTRSNKNGICGYNADRLTCIACKSDYNLNNGYNWGNGSLYGKAVGCSADHNDDDGFEADEDSFYAIFDTCTAYYNSPDRSGNPFLASAGTAFSICGNGIISNCISVQNVRGFTSKYNPTIRPNRIAGCSGIGDVTTFAINCPYTQVEGGSAYGSGMGVEFLNANSYGSSVKGVLFVGVNGTSTYPIKLVNNLSDVTIEGCELQGTWDYGLCYSTDTSLSYINYLNNKQEYATIKINPFSITQNYGKIAGNSGFTRSDEIRALASEILAIMVADGASIQNITLWIPDKQNGTTITDWSGNGRNLVAKKTDETADLFTFTKKPRITGGKLWRILHNGTTEYETAGDSDYFEFTTDGVGTDVAGSVGIGGLSLTAKPGWISPISKILTIPSDQKAWRMEIDPNGKVYFVLNDNTAGGKISRHTTATLSTYTNYLIEGTYDGSKASTGIDVRINGVTLDTNDDNAGVYTCMRNTTAAVNIGVYCPAAMNEQLPADSFWSVAWVIKSHALSGSAGRLIWTKIQAWIGQ